MQVYVSGDELGHLKIVRIYSNGKVTIGKCARSDDSAVSGAASSNSSSSPSTDANTSTSSSLRSTSIDRLVVLSSGYTRPSPTGTTRSDAPPMFLSARSNGVVECWNSKTRRGASGSRAVLGAEIDVKTAGIGYLPSTSRVVHCSVNGKAVVTESIFGPPTTTDTKTASSRTSIFDLGGAIDRMRLDTSDFNTFAVGGKEHPLSLWNVETQTRIFRAKNVKNDFLNLRVPIWITDLAFLNESGGEGTTTQQRKLNPGLCRKTLVTVSAHRHVRLYDCRAQRRPVLAMQTEARHGADRNDDCTGWKSVSVQQGGYTLVAADTSGAMEHVDMRVMKRIGKFKGSCGGSVRSMDSDANTVVSVSLDRHLRVHNLRTRRMERKVYLRQRLNAVLRLPVDGKDDEEEDEEEDGAEEEDNDLEVRAPPSNGSSSTSSGTTSNNNNVWDDLDRNTRRMKQIMRERRQEALAAKMEAREDAKAEIVKQSLEKTGEPFNFELTVTGEGLERPLRGEGTLFVARSENMEGKRAIKGTYRLEKSTGGTYDGAIEGSRSGKFTIQLETSAFGRTLSSLEGVINDSRMRAKLVGVNSIGKYRTWAFALRGGGDDVDDDDDDDDDDDAGEAVEEVVLDDDGEEEEEGSGEEIILGADDSDGEGSSSENEEEEEENSEDEGESGDDDDEDAGPSTGAVSRKRKAQDDELSDEDEGNDGAAPPSSDEDEGEAPRVHGGARKKKRGA